MLINCPRCGFQQPKDHYCAQCGVDIDSFKPTKTPFFLKLIRNPLLQFSVLFIALAGVGSYIYNQNQELNPATLSSQPPPKASPATAPTVTPALAVESSVPTSAEQETSETEAVPTESMAQASLLNAEIGAANSNLAEASEPISAAAKSNLPAVTDSASSGKASTPQLTVVYAEVTRAALNTIMNSSRNTGQFMSLVEYSAGILPGVQNALKNQGITILRKEERSLETNRGFSWFLGTKDPQDPTHEIGMTTFFEISEIEQTALRGNLEIIRSWREPGFGNEPQKKSFPAAFEITAENGFFMAGILPQQSRISNETELTNIDVYKILSSPRFKANESELVIFFQFNRAP